VRQWEGGQAEEARDTRGWGICFTKLEVLSQGLEELDLGADGFPWLPASLSSSFSHFPWVLG
jgi:hypothetical protein